MRRKAGQVQERRVEQDKPPVAGEDGKAGRELCESFRERLDEVALRGLGVDQVVDIDRGMEDPVFIDHDGRYVIPVNGLLGIAQRNGYAGVRPFERIADLEAEKGGRLAAEVVAGPAILLESFVGAIGPDHLSIPFGRPDRVRYLADRGKGVPELGAVKKGAMTVDSGQWRLFQDLDIAGF